MWPCNTKFIRTYKNDNPGNLGNCYAKIPGLSQTCHYFKECGSRSAVGDYKSDVCESSVGDYYKEPEVQRMCGICDMFHAELADSRDTPDEFGKTKEEGGCIADSGIVWRRNGANATTTPVRDLLVGDEVWTPHGYQRVYYIMPHKKPVDTVELSWEGGHVEASFQHLLPVVRGVAHWEEGPSAPMACEQAHSRAVLTSAEEVAIGHFVLVPLWASCSRSKEPHHVSKEPYQKSGGAAKEPCMSAKEGGGHSSDEGACRSMPLVCSQCRLVRVQRTTRRTAHVRYVLVEGDLLVVGGSSMHAGHHGAEQAQESDGIALEGAVLSVYSSPLAAWETLPFRVLDTLVPGILQWAAVGSALEFALQSPLLVTAETALRAVFKGFSAMPHNPAGLGFVEMSEGGGGFHGRGVMVVGGSSWSE